MRMKCIFHICYVSVLLSLSEAWLFSKPADDGVAVTAEGEVIPSPNNQQLTVTFINQSPKAMDIYWDDGSYGKLVVTKVDPREKAELSTFEGHVFHWTVHGRRQQVGGDVIISSSTLEYVLPRDVDLSVDKNACQDRHKRCKSDAKNGECVKNPGQASIIDCCFDHFYID